jgi:hypothetical protein
VEIESGAGGARARAGDKRVARGIAAAPAPIFIGLPSPHREYPAAGAAPSRSETRFFACRLASSPTDLPAFGNVARERPEM